MDGILDTIMGFLGDIPFLGDIIKTIMGLLGKGDDNGDAGDSSAQ